MRLSFSRSLAELSYSKGDTYIHLWATGPGDVLGSLGIPRGHASYQAGIRPAPFPAWVAMVAAFNEIDVAIFTYRRELSGPHPAAISFARQGRSCPGF